MKSHSNLTLARAVFTKSGRHLRRARRLYIRFVRHAINTDPTANTLNLCASHMKEAGLYAELASFKDIRHGILRQLFKFEKDLYPGWDGWFRWTNTHGWERGTYSNYWTRAAKKESAA